jgi:hypothetical protein
MGIIPNNELQVLLIFALPPLSFGDSFFMQTVGMGCHGGKKKS